jgi:hypothetical protein
MFNEIWTSAFQKYNLEKNRLAKQKIEREKFKLNYKKIRDEFNIKHGHLAKKDILILKFVLIKNTNKLLDNEFFKISKYFYSYFVIYYDDFFQKKKIGEKIYMIYFEFICYNLSKKTNEKKKFKLQLKFYLNHDYPFELSKKIIKILNDNYIYVNYLNKEYIYYKIIKLWNSG